MVELVGFLTVYEEWQCGPVVHLCGICVYYQDMYRYYGVLCYKREKFSSGVHIGELSQNNTNRGFQGAIISISGRNIVGTIDYFKLQIAIIQSVFVHACCPYNVQIRISAYRNISECGSTFFLTCPFLASTAGAPQHSIFVDVV
jgi:hypothetical protein